MADEETLQAQTSEEPAAEAAKDDVIIVEVPDPPKPLEKMTAKELREYALQIGNIVGVHSMNKEELLKAIKEAIGIDEASGTKLFAKEIHKVKAEIKELKAGRDKARDEGDKKQVDILRKRIGRLKKKTRRLSAAG